MCGVDDTEVGIEHHGAASETISASPLPAASCSSPAYAAGDRFTNGSARAVGHKKVFWRPDVTLLIWTLSPSVRSATAGWFQNGRQRRITVGGAGSCRPLHSATRRGRTHYADRRGVFAFGGYRTYTGRTAGHIFPRRDSLLQRQSALISPSIAIPIFHISRFYFGPRTGSDFGAAGAATRY